MCFQSKCHFHSETATDILRDENALCRRPPSFKAVLSPAECRYKNTLYFHQIPPKTHCLTSAVGSGSRWALPRGTCQRNQANELSGVKSGEKKPDSWGPTCHRHLDLWPSSPDPAVRVEEVPVLQDFPASGLPHSFKLNLTNQACYSPFSSRIYQDRFCGMGIRELLSRSSPGEVACGRGAATSPFFELGGSWEKISVYGFHITSPHNILVLNQWILLSRCSIDLFFPNQLYNC